MAKIQKPAALSMFIALGMKNAASWTDARLTAKLGQVKSLIDEDVKLENEADQATLAAVLAAIAAEEPIELEGGDPTPAPETKPKAGKTDEEKAAEKAVKDAEAAAKKAAKEAERAEKKAAKDAEAAAKKAAKAAEKDPTATRPGVCGAVLKEKGLSLTTDVKVTEELAAEVDARYGKANPNESAFALRNAKNAILGYLATEVNAKLTADATVE